MNPTLSRPSFTPRRKWSTGLHVAFVLAVVLSVVVMLNYLSHDYFERLHVSTRTRIQLSPRTLNVLKSLTNQVVITLYYDKNDALFSTIVDLLKEYRNVNSRLKVQTVDYERDVSAAERVKADYKLASAADKNLLIFDCEGRIKVVNGNALAEYVLEQNPNDKQGEFRRRPTVFKGEMMFTSALLAVSNPKPLTAYFLTGHGEGRIDSEDELSGYRKLALLLQQNYIQVESLPFTTNALPTNCNLLVIAGPTDPFLDVELERIQQYLNQGGRMLVLFNFLPVKEGKETGLEKLLAQWGVDVSSKVIKDPDRTKRGDDVVVTEFGTHPLVNPLLQSRIHLSVPRAIGRLKSRTQAADAPRVEELAFSSPNSFSRTDPSVKQAFPLIVAVEKGAIRGVITERGTTRIVVAGDSFFLANTQIESAANRDFAGYAANWLLDRPQLLQGLAPQPVPSYSLALSRIQLQRAEGLLLAGMPGAILLFGTLVWFRRRR